MPEEYNRLVEEFLENCYLKNYSKITINNFRAALKKLKEYLEEEDMRLEEVRYRQALRYQKWLIEKQYKKSTIVKEIQCAINFFQYLKKKEKVMSNPFREIKKIKEERIVLRNVLKEKEMANLLNELSVIEKEKTIKRKRRRYRVHVIAELQYSTGMRIMEVAGLKTEDINLEKGEIRIRKGKGGRERVVFLNDYASKIVKIYMYEMRELVLTEMSRKDIVFGACPRNLEEIVNRMVGKVCKELGYNTITSHGFRHSFGYHLLRAGCNIRHIQQLLGHRRLRSTEVYTKVDKKDLKAALDKYHPRQFRRRPDENK